MSDYVTTRTGKKIPALNPQPEDICLEDIAAGLRQFRFNAQTEDLMTVAQHSIHVSQLLAGQGLQLEGLFHDAHEAYTGDLITSFKASCPDFKRIENRWDRAIRQRFKLRALIPEVVHIADKQACLLEGRFLQVEDIETWGLPELQTGQHLEITMALKPNVASQDWLATAIKMLEQMTTEREQHLISGGWENHEEHCVAVRIRKRRMAECTICDGKGAHDGQPCVCIVGDKHGS